MSVPQIFLLLALAGYGSAAHFSRSGATFECPDEGRYQDPRDCTSYFTCVRNTSSITPTRRSCPPATAFSPKSANCVSLEKVPNCRVSHRQGREDNERAPEFDHLCTNSDGFRCGDCKHFIDCQDGKAYMQETCEKDYTCQKNIKNFPYGVCYHRKKDTTVCKCLIGGEQMADPFNVPYGYIKCTEDDTDPECHQCPAGNVYNEEKMLCEDPKNYPDCTKQGEFPVPGDCTKFYHCTSDRLGGFVKLPLACENPLHQYDELTHKCSDPCDWNWSHDHFACKKEGFFLHPTICSDYFKCLSDGKGGFQATHLCCPKHQNFKPEGGNSGKCVPEENHPCVLDGDHKNSPHSRKHHCVKPDYCDAL